MFPCPDSPPTSAAAGGEDVDNQEIDMETQIASRTNAQWILDLIVENTVRAEKKRRLARAIFAIQWTAFIEDTNVGDCWTMEECEAYAESLLENSKKTEKE